MTYLSNQKEVSIINVFMTDLGKYLPPGRYLPIITRKQQEDVLKILKANAQRERFSICIDAQTGQIKHVFGIEKWLGYSEKNFTSQKYYEITHPAHAISQLINGSCIFDIMDEHRSMVDFFSTTYVFTIALRHCKGHYLYCKGEGFSFQLTEDRKCLEFIHELSIIKDFYNEDFRARIYDSNGTRPDLMEKLQKGIKIKFDSIGLFSTQELRILNRYAHKSATITQISNSFKISKTTVATYNKRILDKAEQFFYHRFDNAKKVAEYLKAMRLL